MNQSISNEIPGLVTSDWATSWMIGVQFPAGAMKRVFLYATASRTEMGSTQLPVQQELGALSTGLKRSGRETDQPSHPIVPILTTRGPTFPLTPFTHTYS